MTEKPQEGCFRRISPCTYHIFPGVSLLIKPQKSPPSLIWHHHGLLNSYIPPFDTANACAIRSMKNIWEYFLLERCSRNASHYKHCLMHRCQEGLILWLQQVITRRYPGQNPQLCSAAAQRGVILPLPGSDPHLLTSSSNCCFCLFFIEGLTLAVGCWTVPVTQAKKAVKSYKPFHPILPGCLGERCHSSRDFPVDIPLLSH